MNLRRKKNRKQRDSNKKGKDKRKLKEM